MPTEGDLSDDWGPLRPVVGLQMCDELVGPPSAYHRACIVFPSFPPGRDDAWAVDRTPRASAVL